MGPHVRYEYASAPFALSFAQSTPCQTSRNAYSVKVRLDLPKPWIGAGFWGGLARC